MNIDPSKMNINLQADRLKNDAIKTRGNNFTSSSFGEVLSKIEQNNTLQFSKHAEKRLSIRDISLTSEQLNRIESGISKAGEKGIKDSLVLVDDVALLVNVKSKTVITALDKKSDNVFTNIDGAVIV